MPNSLKIRVGVDAGKTDSRFTVTEYGGITLKNDGSATLNVSFGNTSPLCLSGARQLTVQLTAGQAKNYQACAVTAEQTFKYTATVTGAQPETAAIIVEKIAVNTSPGLLPESNPIIVIHREITGEHFLFGAAGILIGVVLCSFIESRWIRSGPRP